MEAFNVNQRYVNIFGIIIMPIQWFKMFDKCMQLTKICLYNQQKILNV